MNKFLFGMSLIFSTSVFAAQKTEIVVTEKNCSAINKALAALPAAGGVVRLTEGTYNCEEPIEIKTDGVSIVGAGSKKTLIKALNGKPLPLLVIGIIEVEWRPDVIIPGQHFYPVRETKNTTIAGLTIDGNRHTQPDNYHNECYDAEERTTKNCQGDGGKWIRTNGITIRRASHVRMYDVASHRNPSGGMVLEKLSTDVVVDGFASEDNYFDGLAGYQTNFSTFKNIYLGKNRAAGISIDLRFEDNKFENVVLAENGDVGIFSNGVNRNTYDKIVVRNSGSYGIWIDGHHDEGREHLGTCDGHVIKNLIAFGNGNAAVRFNRTCLGNVIEKAAIKKGKAKECIEASPTATYSSKEVTCVE